MIPKFHEIMLPLLQLLADGHQHSYKDLVEALAKNFQLTSEERTKLLGSGTQSVFDNRVGWAGTYLKKAGLLDSPQRATSA